MKAFFNIALGLSLLAMGIACRAAGMQPETTIVQVNSSDMMTPFNLTNTDKTPLLLHSKVLPLPEDKAPLLVASPSVIRVEPGKVQTVNFMLNSPTPLTQQRLRRVIFVGIPPAAPAKSFTIHFNVQQNLPVIISPANLKTNYEPWKLLQWSAQNTTISVHNPSPYVVRLAPNISVAQGHWAAVLPQTYILPGETINTALLTPQHKPMQAGTPITPLEVSFWPANLHGSLMDAYHCNLLLQAPTPSHLEYLSETASTPSAASSPVAKVSASASALAPPSAQ